MTWFTSNWFDWFGLFRSIKTYNQFSSLEFHAFRCQFAIWQVDTLIHPFHLHLLLFFYFFFYFLLISVISFLNKLILLRLQLVFTWYCFFILIFVRLKKIGKNFYFWFCFLLLLFIILNCQYKEQLVLRDRIFLWILNIWKIHFLRIDIFDSNYNKEFFCV